VSNSNSSSSSSSSGGGVSMWERRKSATLLHWCVCSDVMKENDMHIPPLAA